MEWALNVIMFIEVIIEYMSFFYIIFRKILWDVSIKRILYIILVIVLYYSCYCIARMLGIY